MKKLFIFAIIFGLHAVAAFWAWAEASRGRPALLIWRILATPVFNVAGPLANQYFWPLFLLNSLLWGTVLSYLVIRVSRYGANAL